MRSMFGISPKRATYPNDGCSPSLMNMRKEIYDALSGLRISWLCHFIGRHPMLMYNTPSGLALSVWQPSPERATYPNDGCSPSLMNMRKEIYAALSGLRISWLCHFIGLPMLRYYALSGQAPTGQNTLEWGIALSYNNTGISSPVRARYISEAVSPLANKKEAV